MKMTKQQFIALADAIREHNDTVGSDVNIFRFDDYHISTLAAFCQSQNPLFKRQLWIDYIAGKAGPNGGRVS